MSELFEKGLKVRKEVLGEDYVNKSIAGADEFTRTMAEWSTEFCWGALWTRPGLDRRTRSIVNLAMLGALGRPHELKLHVKGALKNGVRPQLCYRYRVQRRSSEAAKADVFAVPGGDARCVLACLC